MASAWVPALLSFSDGLWPRSVSWYNPLGANGRYHKLGVYGLHVHTVACVLPAHSHEVMCEDSFEELRNWHLPNIHEDPRSIPRPM